MMTDEKEDKHQQGRTSRRRGKGEGSIYYDKKNQRYVGSFYAGDGRRRYVYGKSEKEAREKLRDIQYAEKQGMLATGPTQTLKQYLVYWIEEVHKPTIRVSTYIRYRTILEKHLLPALGHIQLRKLTIQHIQRLYASKLQEGLSARTIRLIQAVLHKALENAVRENLVSRNICDVVTLPRSTKYEVQTLTSEQARLFLQAVRGQQLEALLTLALTTGMRHGEMLGLHWRDINFEDRSLQVRRSVGRVGGYGYVEAEPKTPKSRRQITLPQFVIDSLKQHRAHQLEARLRVGDAWQDRDLVFCNTHGGFLDSGRNLIKFQTFLSELGLPRMRLHDLRHSAATLLLGMGVHPKVVQELLGHSHISMTMDTYSHVLPGMQQEAMDKWDSQFGG
jgi:integrase